MTSGHTLRTSLLFIVFLQHFCVYFFIHFFIHVVIRVFIRVVIRVFIRAVIRVFIRVVIRVSVRRHGVNFVVETLQGATTTWGVFISLRYGHEVVFFFILELCEGRGHDISYELHGTILATYPQYRDILSSHILSTGIRTGWTSKRVLVIHPYDFHVWS